MTDYCGQDTGAKYCDNEIRSVASLVCGRGAIVENCCTEDVIVTMGLDLSLSGSTKVVSRGLRSAKISVCSDGGGVNSSPSGYMPQLIMARFALAARAATHFSYDNVTTSPYSQRTTFYRMFWGDGAVRPTLCWISSRVWCKPVYDWAQALAVDVI